MTLHEEPPIVDIVEVLREDEEQHHHRVTPVQWVLVIVGGVVGVTGLLIALVVAAPAVIDLVSWINKAVNR